jgi:hypothetical protein
MTQRMPIESPDREVVSMPNRVCWVYRLNRSVLWVRVVVRRDGRGYARRWILLVQEIVVDAAVHATSRQQVPVHRMPCHAYNILVVPAEEQDITHHTYVEYASCVVARTGCQKVPLCRLKLCF